MSLSKNADNEIEVDEVREEDRVVALQDTMRQRHVTFNFDFIPSTRWIQTKPAQALESIVTSIVS